MTGIIQLLNLACFYKPLHNTVLLVTGISVSKQPSGEHNHNNNYTEWYKTSFNIVAHNCTLVDRSCRVIGNGYIDVL